MGAHAVSLTPRTPAPWNFRPGITIRDNYVAQNGRVGISWTGGAGASMCAPGNGTVVLNNHVEVRAGTTCYTVNGDSDAGGADTNENRGYMNSGYCSNITGNTGRVNRQRAGATPYDVRVDALHWGVLPNVALPPSVHESIDMALEVVETLPYEAGQLLSNAVHDAFDTAYLVTLAVTLAIQVVLLLGFAFRAPLLRSPAGNSRD